ncbi:hypothetical protein PFZ49_09655, partial [Microbacterium lacticum]
MAKNPAKSQTRLAPERRAALVADYEAGMPVRAIAAKYGVHRGTIPTLVLRAGASLRTPGLDDAGRARASALYAGGLVKSRGVVSLRLFPVVGGGSGGEVALGAGLLGVIVQG